MDLTNTYFIIGNAYAGKSTAVKGLAERYGGIACVENYHEKLMDESLDKEQFPCLCYTRDMTDWRQFIRRTPEEYAAWIDGAAKECEILELRLLEDITMSGKPVFVDTNICIETLHKLGANVLVMLADPMISVNRFFERPDREKQFIYGLLMDEPDPDAAMANYREILMRINSKERYDRLRSSGFPVILRDDNRTIGQTLDIAAEALGLPPADIRIMPVERGTELADELMQFVRECSWTDVKEHICNMLDEWVFTDWEGMLAAVKDGRIIGMASMMKTDYYPLPDIYPWISCIFVSEEYRGQHISGRLISYANERLRQLGFDRSYIPTEYTGLYEHYGYSYVRDITNYGGGTDRLYMKEI